MRTPVLQGIRWFDALLAAILVGLAVVLAAENVLSTGASTRIDSHSWWQVPVAAATAAPVLWWRRSVPAVMLACCALMAVHLVAFGQLIRCGSGLPLAFVLSFLAGMAPPDRRQRWFALAASALLGVLVLVWDTVAGPEILPVVLPLQLLLFGIGRVAANRTDLARQLTARNEELRRLRDERTALEVHDDRSRLSAQLQQLLDQRLAQLSASAEAGTAVVGNGVAGGDGARASNAATLLASLERDSRQTLAEMRELVGRLRGGEVGEVSLAPAPTVAHLDALLAQHLDGRRLRVTGDPRLLPAGVELSAYRIVEHLITALAVDPATRVDVGLRFDDDALQIEVSGPVTRGTELRTAVGRARERARLHAGSLDVRLAHGQARVVAHLPVADGA